MTKSALNIKTIEKIIAWKEAGNASYAQIAKLLGLSRQRVCQIYLQYKDRIRVDASLNDKNWTNDNK